MNLKNEQLNILVVEDDTIAQLTLSRMLQDMGFTSIQVASDGVTALEIMDTAGIDILITDVIIKGSINGIELASAVNKKSDIPILYLTASTEPEYLERIAQTQHYGVLEKPYNYDTIQKAITELISKNPTEE